MLEAPRLPLLVGAANALVRPLDTGLDEGEERVKVKGHVEHVGVAEKRVG